MRYSIKVMRDRDVVLHGELVPAGMVRGLSRDSDEIAFAVERAINSAAGDRLRCHIDESTGETEAERLRGRIIELEADLGASRRERDKTPGARDFAAISAVRELIRLAECGQSDVLTIDNLRDAIDGVRTDSSGGPLRFFDGKIGSIPYHNTAREK